MLVNRLDGGDDSGYRTNTNRSGHILTVEDPIEFVHEHKKCIVTQREVGPTPRARSRPETVAPSARYDFDWRNP
ncbi:type IV pilus twitching motility protein PilT [Vibrio chagasii]|nr:type IV pilus twitching motility protein PilT [Vibrio chagasii]